MFPLHTAGSMLAGSSGNCKGLETLLLAEVHTSLFCLPLGIPAYSLRYFLINQQQIKNWPILWLVLFYPLGLSSECCHSHSSGSKARFGQLDSSKSRTRSPRACLLLVKEKQKAASPRLRPWFLLLFFTAGAWEQALNSTRQTRHSLTFWSNLDFSPLRTRPCGSK